jgi:catechol 2,3-dioxygenase-like lactoylglutathione lyase family enzyme
MKGELRKVWGYQGNNMALPVANLEAALPFYEQVMGFRVLSRSDSPHRSAVLARDSIQIGFAENGGDPTQDGCAFEVDSAELVFAGFKENGFEKDISGFDIEKHDDASWKVFYVVAPDGLCYWFGERLAG